MQIIVDYDEYVSILTYVRHLSRKLEPVIREELSALLGRRTPSGLAHVAVDACCMAIEDGARIEGEWVEVGYSDGGVDWAWRESTVYSDTARSLIPL